MQKQTGTKSKVFILVYGISEGWAFFFLSLNFPQTQNYFLGCFLLKFGLTVCAYLLGFGFTLNEVVCLRARNLTAVANATTITCTELLTAR